MYMYMYMHMYVYVQVVSSLLVPLLPTRAALGSAAGVANEARAIAAMHCLSECILQVFFIEMYMNRYAHTHGDECGR